MKNAAELYNYAFDPAGESTAARIVKLVGREKKVLELGPGPGSITRVLREYGNCTITGIELDPQAAQEVANWCERIQVSSLDEPDWSAFIRGESFDVVVMADVLEHLRNPVETLKQAASFLKPDGYCVISLPNIAHNGILAALLTQAFPYQDTGLLDRTHIRFYARQNLPQLLAEAGLLLAECQEVQGTPQHTEFAPQWFQLTEEQKKILEKNMEGNTYQFVLKALPDTPENRQSLLRPVAAQPPENDLWSYESRQLLRFLHEQNLYAMWKQLGKQKELAELTQISLQFHALRATFLGKIAHRVMRIRQILARKFGRTSVPATTPLSEVTLMPLEQRVSLTLAQYDLPKLPMITVVFDPQGDALDSPTIQQTIDSIQTQTYTNLQILFVRHSLEKLMPALNPDKPWDTRWRALSTAKARGSTRPAEAIEFAEGELVLFLQPGDILLPEALHDLATTFLQHPGLSLLTFNHEANSEQVTLPGWSHEFHLAQNSVGRAVAFRTEALKNGLGTFSVQSESPYNWMMATWACLDESRCLHRHRSLMRHASAKEWRHEVETFPFCEKIIAKRFPGASLEKTPQGLGRILHPIALPHPLVSILIPTKNAAHLVKVCLDSLLAKTDYPNYEILLIDNGSDDPAALALFQNYAENPRIQVIRDDAPFNFSAINNRAAKQAKGEYLLLLNNDTEVITPHWLTAMMGHAQHAENGAIGARLWYPNDTLQHGGVVIVGGGPNHHFSGFTRNQSGPLNRAWITQRYLAVTAACLLVRTNYYWQVGGLDESYAVGFNDVDFCFRLHACGYRNIWVAEAELYHHESPSRGFDTSPAKKARAAAEYARLCSHWNELMQNDPFV